MKYICENCGTEHDGKYASGRFCSKECARGFSTKNKRSLINKKVSDTLKSKANPDVSKICPVCKKNFTVHWSKRRQETCSNSCARKKLGTNKKYIKKLSIAMINAHKDGKMNVSKRAIRCFYKFKDKNIRCDSKVEYACLDYFMQNYNVTNIERCNFFIEYKFENKIKRYLPDFKIYTNDKVFIVECKSFFKITDDVKKNKAWLLYYNTIESKKIALNKYCIKNGYESFFFTKMNHKKFYDSLDRKKLTCL